MSPWSDMKHPALIPLSGGCSGHEDRLSTRYSPVRHSRLSEESLPFDLHVLSTPPAFVLSQDQTLQLLFPDQSLGSHQKSQGQVLNCFRPHPD